MKKIVLAVSIVIALVLLAATAVIVTGCGEDKSKSSSKTDSTKAPTSATTATVAATLPTTSSYTLAPVPQATNGDDETTAPDETTAAATEDDEEGYYGQYGGISGQDAILKALGYAGAGYQCVSYEKQYLQNREAWFVGVQATSGSDDTVYYLYVNADECVPVTDIPAVGDNSDQPGNHGGITQKQAVAIALQNVDGNYSCISYEQIEIDGVEYWRVGLQNDDSEDGDITYYLVNNNSCFEE